MKNTVAILLSGLFILAACSSAGQTSTTHLPATLSPQPTATEIKLLPTPASSGDSITWDELQVTMDQLEITQSARFFWYQYQRQPPIPNEEIVSHATNLHLIPSNKSVAAQCKSLRTGQLIHLSGLLVEATGPDIGTWRSSLSRTDSGNGACELVWVEELEQISP